MVSQLFVELSIGGTWWTLLTHWSWLASVFAFEKCFGDAIILKRRLRFCLRFRLTIICEYWVRSRFWRLGSQTNTSFLCSHCFFLKKFLVETATRKCLISVYGKDCCGDSCNSRNPFFCHNKEATSNRSKALFRIESMTVMLINLFVAKKVHFVVWAIVPLA